MSAFTARAVRCHFGEWMQGRNGPHGALLLLTLMGPDLHVRAEPEGIALVPQDVLDRFADDLGIDATGLRCTSDITPGCGGGVSTAALVLHARAAGVTDPHRIARACLAAEGAVDPLMLARPDTALWASRAATQVATLAPPRAEIVGGLWGDPTPTDPRDTDFPDISDLLPRWRDAAGDLPTLAALASTSASRTTALRGPQNDPTEALVARVGALGWARAHTGSARALIFAPGTAPDGLEEVLCETGFAAPLRAQTGNAP